LANVEDQSGFHVTPAAGHLQFVFHELLPHVVGQCLAQDHAAVQFNHGGQILPSRRGSDVRDVPYQHFFGRLCCEVPIQAIRGDFLAVLRILGRLPMILWAMWLL